MTNAILKSVFQINSLKVLLYLKLLKFYLYHEHQTQHQQYPLNKANSQFPSHNLANCFDVHLKCGNSKTKLLCPFFLTIRLHLSFLLFLVLCY